MHRPWLRNLLVAVLVLAPSTLTAGTLGSGEDWSPAALGNRWIYEVESGERQDLRRRRETHEVVEVARSRFGPLFRIQQTPSYAPNVPHEPGELLPTQVWESRRKGAVLLHSVDRGRGLERMSSPFVDLPAQPKQGMTWDAGKVPIDGIRVTARGEVVGYADARTPAGVYADCLLVRYHGEGTGPIRVNGESSAATLRYRSTVWYAHEVGPVRWMERTDVSFRLPGTRRVVQNALVERATLRSFEPGPLARF